MAGNSVMYRPAVHFISYSLDQRLLPQSPYFPREHRLHNFLAASSPWSQSIWSVFYEVHILDIGFGKVSLKDSNYARQHSVALETTTARVLTMSMMTTLCLSLKVVEQLLGRTVLMY